MLADQLCVVLSFWRLDPAYSPLGVCSLHDCLSVSSRSALRRSSAHRQHIQALHTHTPSQPVPPLHHRAVPLLPLQDQLLVANYRSIQAQKRH